MGLHLKRPTFLHSYNRIWVVSADFNKSPRIKFHGNPSSGSRADIHGETDRLDEVHRHFSWLCEHA